MTPQYDKVHNRFKLNGHHYNYDDLRDVAYSFTKEGDDYEIEMGSFLMDWLDNKPTLIANTSGSTGLPKPITIQKQAMVSSAVATGNFFKLFPGDSALHVLPTRFIAGKMMIVRAIILGLELDIITPRKHPLKYINKTYNFSAMTPFQVLHSLEKINQIKILIIGGAKVPVLLKQKLKGLKTKAFETFGMTETITHIAVKPLNHFDDNTANFVALPSISFRQNADQCLIVNAPSILDKPLVTNDVVELVSETEFKWLGRKDDVINSGGIKLFPELIESKLETQIKKRFFVTAIAHKTLGEQVALVIEGKSYNLSSNTFSELKKLEVPKQIYFIDAFSETKNGKIQRKNTMKRIFNTN